MIYTVEELKNRYSKIVAWGAGRVFSRFNHELTIDYVVDKDQSKWGSMVVGVPVKSPDVLREEDNIAVIISIEEWKETAIEIIKLGNADFYLPEEIVPNPFVRGKYKRSYSEFGEDAILMGLMNKLDIQIHHYLDIGANHPVNGNATFWLYERGIKGGLVEPNPRKCAILKEMRPRDIVFECGISDDVHNGDMARYYDFEEIDTRNTFSDSVAKNVMNMGYKCTCTDIKMRSLNSIMDEYGAEVDYINIDAEGYEWNILKDFDFARYGPAVFNIEKGNPKVQDLIENMDYRLVSETLSNWIFVQNKKRDN